MSLLDDNFDINIDDIVASSLKSMLVGNLNKSHRILQRSKLGKFAPGLPKFTEDTIPKVLVSEIEFNETDEYYIGYSYLAPSNIIRFKLFNPNNIQVRNDGPNLGGYCRIGNYSMLGANRSFTDSGLGMDDRWGWIKLNINDIINCYVGNVRVITPLDEIMMKCVEAIEEGIWVC